MNNEYRILIQETRTIKGGTCIPMCIPACFQPDKSNIFLGEIANFRNLKFGKRLNNYGTCSFDIQVDDLIANALISLCQYSVWIYRVTPTGNVLVWSGEQRRRTGKVVENHDDWCTIYCYDWLYALKDRFTAAEIIYTYASIDQNTGLTLPTAAFNNTNIGTIGWSNEDNILIDDDNFASVDFGGTEKVTYYLAGSCSFSIPSDATITGIKAIVSVFNDKGSPSHYAKDTTVNLVHYGTGFSENRGNNEDQSTSLTNVEYGGENDLWGMEWTPAMINDAEDFFLNLSYTGYGSIINVNYIKLIIYYSTRDITKVTDAGAIAWDLIETSQLKTNGNLGITEGTIATTQDRTRTYNNQNIMEAIINLSDVIGGFDFEITDDRVFNVYTVKGDDLTESLILEYGRNLKNATIDEDFTTPCNNAIVLGEVTDATDLSRVDRPDTTTQVKYKLREMVLSADNVVDLDTLNSKGDAMLYKYQEPLIKVTFEVIRGTINVTQFSLGDLIRLIIKKGIYNIDSDYRIFEWSVNYEDDNTEKLSLVLGELGI